MTEPQTPEKKPANIVLEVQSLRHVLNLTTQPQQVKKEIEKHG